MSAPAPLVVVSGPSGVGKSTVVARVLELDPSIWLSVSATTRSPRPGEQDGREYFFVSDGGFDELIARSDAISVHVPLTRATRGLIGKDQLDRMRPGAISVSTKSRAASMASRRPGENVRAGIASLQARRL